MNSWTRPFLRERGNDSWLTFARVDRLTREDSARHERAYRPRIGCLPRCARRRPPRREPRHPPRAGRGSRENRTPFERDRIQPQPADQVAARGGRERAVLAMAARQEYERARRFEAATASAEAKKAREKAERVAAARRAREKAEASRRRVERAAQTAARHDHSAPLARPRVAPAPKSSPQSPHRVRGGGRRHRGARPGYPTKRRGGDEDSIRMARSRRSCRGESAMARGVV